MLTGGAKVKERKRLHHLKHKLQKVLFPKNREPRNVVRDRQSSMTLVGLKANIQPKELLAADGLLKKLEGLGALQYPDNLQATRIHKVLKEALVSSTVPSMDQWHLKKRIHVTLKMYEARLEAVKSTTETVGDDAEDVISLPHALEETVENLVHWIYRQQLAAPGRSQDGICPALTPQELVQLYTLADFLKMSRLQNVIADKLDSISPTLEDFRQMILYASANPTTESRLLLLLVRMYSRHTTSAEMRRAAGDWMEKDVVVELAAVLLKDQENNKGKGAARQGPRCEYHVHNTANPPCR